MEINVVNGSYTVQRLAIIPYSAFLRILYTQNLGGVKRRMES